MLSSNNNTEYLLGELPNTIHNQERDSRLKRRGVQLQRHYFTFFLWWAKYKSRKVTITTMGIITVHQTCADSIWSIEHFQWQRPAIHQNDALKATYASKWCIKSRLLIKMMHKASNASKWSRCICGLQCRLSHSLHTNNLLALPSAYGTIPIHMAHRKFLRKVPI